MGLQFYGRYRNPSFFPHKPQGQQDLNRDGFVPTLRALTLVHLDDLVMVKDGAMAMDPPPKQGPSTCPWTVEFEKPSMSEEKDTEQQAKVGTCRNQPCPHLLLDESSPDSRPSKITPEHKNNIQKIVSVKDQNPYQEDVYTKQPI